MRALLFVALAAGLARCALLLVRWHRRLHAQLRLLGLVLEDAREAIKEAQVAADAARGADAARRAVDVTSRSRTVDQALTTGQRFIGEGAQEIAPGVFRSADGSRQFRMTDADITGAHGKIGPHVHFEKFDPATGQKIKNIHTPLADP